MTSLEKEILEIKDFYRSILDSIINGVWVTDANDIIHYTNKGMEKIAGIPVKQIVGVHVLKDFPESTLKYFRPHYLKVKETLKPVFYDALPVVTPAGRRSYQSGWLIPRIKDGKYDGVLCTVDDVTERKKAERKLKESEQKFRTLVSNIPGAVYRVAADEYWTVEIISDAIKGISGFPASDFIQNKVRSYASIIHPDDVELVEKIVYSAIDKGEPYIIEYRIINSNGEVVWVYEKGQGILGEDGEILWLDGAIFDITKRKEAELKLQKLNVKLEKIVEERTKKLRTSEEKYRYLIENSLEGVWVIDSNANTILINPSMAKMLGYTIEEMVGKSLFLFMDEKEIKNTKINLERRKKGISEERDSEMIHKNGKKVYLRIRASPIFDIEGNYEGTFAFLNNITQRKLTEQILKESEENYREAYNLVNFYKDLFAHDMNNILQSILSTAEFHSIIRDDPEKLKNFGDISELVKMHVGRGTSLISKVRTLSKLEETEIKLIPIVISDVLNKSVENTINSFHNKDIKIQIEGLLKDLKIMGDNLLIEVFDNILNNAIKFNDDDNEVKVDIIISKIQADDINYIKFEFKDNGKGIPDDRKEILFQELFERDKSKRGMGMGLTLIKKIVDQYDGRIRVEDRIKGNYKEGCNFVLLLKGAP